MPGLDAHAVGEAAIGLEQVGMLRLALMDADGSQSGEMSERNSRQYLAWANSLSRLLRQIGLKGAAQPQPTLRDHLAKRQSGASA